MSGRRNSNNPHEGRDKRPSFDETVEWAIDNINNKRERHTWNDKFWYVIGGIIVLIIILGLIYVFYWRRNRPPPPNQGDVQNNPNQGSLLDSINHQSNHIPPVSVATPRPPIPSGAPITSPGGSYLPAMSNGVQRGWWYYPPRT